jgi:excisionase family DNA binding protein
VDECAQILRLGRSAAYEAIARGDIPTIRIGRRLLIPKIALDRMLSEAGQRKELEAE